MTIKLWDEGIEPFVFPTPEQPVNPPDEHPKHWGMMMCKPTIIITGIDKYSFKEKSISINFIDFIPVDLEGIEINSQQESDFIITEALAVLENLLSRRCKVVLEELEVE